MNREIKFRGLDRNGKWQIGTYYFGVLYPNSFSGHYINDTQIDENTIGQFTGLKDKDGTEIYEDDIVKIREAERTYVVKFDFGCFKLFHADPKLNDMLWGTIERVSELIWKIEVIGNIYENPELLNK